MPSSWIGRRRAALCAAAAATLLVACDAGSTSQDPFTSVPTTSSSPIVTPEVSSASPTPPATPAGELPTSGAASASCEGGWIWPAPDSEDFATALKVIRREVEVPGDIEVVEIRLFEGPESPPSDKGYLKVVRRWYVKLYTPSDLTFQGRFLVEKRQFGAGLVAVAPYDTAGFSSPDWVGFQDDGSDPDLRAYPGLPGTWRGIPYDFVDGGEDLTIPGLPDAVRGCLEGT
jgi:hypothetical protein